jgi:hypothetical protein
MRFYEILNENYQMVSVSSGFLKEVSRLTKKISADSDLPNGPEFETVVMNLLKQIDGIAGIGSLMTVWRAELHPKGQETNLSSTGSHWSWHADSAKVYDDENAEYFHKGKEELVEVVLEADVKFKSIDWPYTVATNLILPNEREITVRPGSIVNVMGLYVGRNEIPFESQLPVIGQYER